MPLPNFIPLTTFNLHRPFGTDAAGGTFTGFLSPAAATGRAPGSGNPRWTHTLDVDEDVDIRDGCTRIEGMNEITYADGDEVRIPSGSAAGRYVVVWVESHHQGTPTAFKRVYLMRHSI